MDEITDKQRALDSRMVVLPEGKAGTRRRWWLVVSILLFSDALVAALFWFVAYLAYALVEGRGPSWDITIAVVLPSAITWIGVRAMVSLYPGYGLSQAEELRRQTIGTISTSLLTVIYIFAATIFVGTLFPIAIAGLNFVERLLLAPLTRHLVKRAMTKLGVWGKPTIVLGAGEAGKQIVRLLNDEWGLGFKVIAVCDFRLAAQGRVVEDVPYIGTIADALILARDRGIETAIFAMPNVRREHVGAFVDKASDNFRHVVVVPNVAGVIASAVESRDLGSTFGLEIKQNLLNPWARRLKRAFDLVVVIVGGLLVSPLLISIIVLIRIDSPGSPFYKQERIGTGGRRFHCWKFRSMYADAGQLLTELLRDDPGLRAEWERNHKLHNDPRITRVGLFLRKYSLDELAQLWNVLQGEMSLIGPRPIVDAEIPKYEEAYGLYKRVKPGMSGLWQVSGRSGTSYEERVDMDRYYVRNWSIWLDQVLLARTVGAVFRGRGAV